MSAWKSSARKTGKAVRQQEIKREKEVLSNGTDNHFWRYVNSKLSSRTGLPVIQREDGSLAETDHEKATAMNEYFASVFQDDKTGKMNFDDEKVKPSRTVSFPPELVYAHLFRLPAKFSAGPDGLPSILFKKLAFQLSQPLSSIFEVSFHTGSLPSDWLESLVTPIHKKGCKSTPVNYRPVSLTCVACRVMEKIIKEVIVGHLSKNGLISKSQHGFLSKRSTVTQLLETLNDWMLAADKKEAVDVAYADISKAFDRIPHSKILESFSAYGVKDTLLTWLEAFLSNRTQRVIYNDCQSDTVPVASGVPQGSVLGPLCFLVVVNRLPEVIKHATVKLFADDCKLYFRISSNVGHQIFLQDLCSLFEWAISYGLTLALNKTAIMHLGRSNPCRGYKIHDADLSVTECIKDLGVIFTKDLKFASHVNLICKKAFSRVNLIYLAFYSKNSKFLVQMFKTFVRPLLDYASPVWSPYLRKDIDLLERVQKYFTRRLPGITGDYLQRLSVLKRKQIDLEILELRRLQTDLILLYKIINGLCDLDFDILFEWSSVTRTRGHSLKLKAPRSRLDCRRNFYASRVVNPWNSLSSETVNAKSLSVFVKRLQLTERDKLISFLNGSVSTVLKGRG